jgi:flagellar hook-basal body complex protein FliE
MLRRSVSLSLLPRMHRAIASHGPVQLQQGRTCRELPVRPTNQDSNAEPALEEPNVAATVSAAAPGGVEGLQKNLDESRRAVTNLQAKLDNATAAVAVDRSRASDLQEILDESRRAVTDLQAKLGEATAAVAVDRGRADDLQEILDESRCAVTDLQAKLGEATAAVAVDCSRADFDLQEILDKSRRAVTDLQAKVGEATAAAGVDRGRADFDLLEVLDDSRRAVIDLQAKVREATAAADVDRSRADFDLQESLDESRRAVTDLQAKLGEAIAAVAVDRSRADNLQESLGNLLTARPTVNHGKARADCPQTNAVIDHRAVTLLIAATDREDVDSTEARRTARTADWTFGLTFVLWSAALATGAFYTGQRAAETTAATPMTPNAADTPTNVRCVDPSGSRMPEPRPTTATTWATQLHYWMLYVSTMALAFVMCAAFCNN